MSSFGAQLIGYSATLDAFTDLKETWGGDAAAVVGTNVEYSPFVELGTSKMQAQPHLRPAVEAMVRRADAIAAQADSSEDLVKLLALDVEAGTKRRAPVGETGNLKASYRTELL